MLPDHLRGRRITGADSQPHRQFFDVDRYEPLLDDRRVEQLAHKLRSEFGFGLLQDADFVTFIQPATVVTRQTPDGLEYQQAVDDMAIFAVVEPNPRRPSQKIVTTGTVLLDEFRRDEAAMRHYANAPDSAHTIYRQVVPAHIRKIRDLRDLIN